MSDVTAMERALRHVDPDIHEAIVAETVRQHEQLELIASENAASVAVLEALGSTLTNKYAEGYPAARWYGGCEFVDVAERLAIERVQALFGAEHVNVQPHSGTQANVAVLSAVLKPGETILSMNLAHGGHLSHGHPKNFSGKTYTIVPYGVSEADERINYETIESLAREHRPRLILAGYSAYPRALDFARFRQIADTVGAYLLVDMAHFAGLVAAGMHPSPVPHAEFVTTTTHKTLRGPRGGMILCRQDFAKAINAEVFPGIQGGPLMHVIAAKAVALKEALDPSFRTYQQQVVQNAQALAKELMARGFRMVSGGTDNHLCLVDVRGLDLTGKEAQAALERANITVNKNAIPFDTLSPMKAGGIRLGTPCLTTRGMGVSEMAVVAECIERLLKQPHDDTVIREVRARVAALVEQFPMYAALRAQLVGGVRS